MSANAPTSLVLTPSGTSITLTWDSNTPVTPPVQAYDAEIFRSTDGGATFIHIWTTSAVGTGVTWTDTYLYNSKTYYYKVRQTLPDGVRSAFSSTQNAATAASSSAPSTPIIDTLTTAAGVSTVAIDLFFRSGPGGGERFIIERCLGTGCSGFVPALDRLPGTNKSGNYHYVTGTTVTDGGDYTPSGVTNLLKCTYYRYRAIAVNATGNSAYSNQIEIKTPCDVNVPLTPFQLEATTISSSAIDLIWNDNSANELGFILERSIYDGNAQAYSAWTAIATVDSDIEAYSDTGLVRATTYRYRVKAFNSNGESAYSNIATATTSTGSSTITVPSNLIGVADSTPQVVLTWNDNSTNEDGFKIERADVGGGFTVIFSTGANVHTYTDTAVQNGKSYLYRIRAFNTTDYSNYSSTISVGVGTAMSGFGYGIYHDTEFNISIPSIGGQIKDNVMYNNGKGNIMQGILTLQDITIDNPASENLYIRRGVRVYEN